MTTPDSNRGFAIVSVLLVLAVLTIMVVAFMQSMRIDRLTSRAYLNKAAAEAAARAGVAEAMNRTAQAILENPFHTVAYHSPSSAAAEDAPITAIFGSSDPTTAPTYTYLASSLLPGNPPDVSTPGDYIDLNSLGTGSEAYGWIGSEINPTTGVHERKDFHANWIEILSDPGQPEQPDSNQANYNPVVARYAFWVEDETSKINFRVSGNAEGTDGTFQRSALSNRAADIDLGSLPFRESSGNWLPLAFDSASGFINQSLINMFASGTPANQVFDPRLINRNEALNPSGDEDIFERIKFHATPYSRSLDTNRFGKPRINLNALVTNNSNDPNLPPDPTDIQGDLTDLILAMTGQLHPLHSGATNRILADEYDPAPSPNFGLRFFSGAADTDPDALGIDESKYLLRLAANIRDYLDSDAYPTIVDFTGQVETPPSDPALALAWRQNEEPWAVGKEGIPYFQEHMWRAQEKAWVPIAGSNVRYVVSVDHYLEFFNPSTKDYTAPQDMIIRIYSQPTWLAGSHPDLIPDDMEIDISGVVFPAGRATVITTDPSPPPLGSDPSNIISVAPAEGRRLYTGLTNEVIDGDIGLQLSGRSSAYRDYETEMVVSGPGGLLQSHPYIAISIASGSDYFDLRGEQVNSTTQFFYSSSLRGNDGQDRTGDPRSLNEQLYYQGGSSSLDNNRGTQTRFYGGVAKILNNSNHTIGRARIGFVNPETWPDYSSPLQDTPETAYGLIKDGLMESIGELGHIYDPHRIASSHGILYSRGGGRTLRIGQSEDVVATSPRFTGDWNRAAWHLTDTFGVANNPSQVVLPLQSPALININSVLRDGGTALRAVLRDMEFIPDPESDPDTSGKLLSEAEISALISSIETYLQNTGPILHRGEISEISFFNPTDSSNPTFAGEQTRQINDRAREEVFRRIVELVSTKSTTFTVYAVGEALRQNQTGDLTRVARQRYKVLFELEPEDLTDPNATLQSLSTKIIYESF